MDKYRINLEFVIDLNRYKIEAFYPIANNGCCEKDFFILTSNKSTGGINYSCQCACNGWCTNGHATAQAAIDEYRAMCKLHEAEKRGIRKWDMPI